MTNFTSSPAAGLRIMLSAQQSALLRQSIAPQAIVPLGGQKTGAMKPERSEQKATARGPLRRFLRWVWLTVLTSLPWRTPKPAITETNTETNLDRSTS